MHRVHQQLDSRSLCVVEKRAADFDIAEVRDDEQDALTASGNTIESLFVDCDDCIRIDAADPRGKGVHGLSCEA